ncbi:unnamed protein product [Victoria cruziana]
MAPALRNSGVWKADVRQGGPMTCAICFRATIFRQGRVVTSCLEAGVTDPQLTLSEFAGLTDQSIEFIRLTVVLKVLNDSSPFSCQYRHDLYSICQLKD